jgi:Ser/Thr protein kinase RdoA (MazF antagonist)
VTVKTPFSADELRAIIADYELGEYVGSHAFERGADQTNLLLTTSQGKYAFRYYEKRPEDYIHFEMRLLRFLGDQSYPSPAPVRRRDDSDFGMYKGKPYALFTFLDGEHDDRLDNYRLVTPALAWLHNLTRGRRLPYAESRAPYGASYARSFAETNAAYIADPSEAQARLDWFKAELATLQLPRGLPKGICHCDTNPSNFLYKNSKLSATLDFDQASYTWLLYDVAQMIYWWTWPGKGDLQLEESRDLIIRYETVRKLGSNERRHLFDALKLVHLVGIGWSLADDSFPNDKRKVVDLDALGRDRFYDAIFRHLA